jgi:DNA-binding MarR family transcriptional regulator
VGSIPASRTKIRVPVYRPQCPAVQGAFVNPYINFVNLLKAISASDTFPKLAHLQRLVLDEIALNEFQGHPLTVRELLTNQAIASPATLHKHLMALRRLGYVYTASVSDDRRSKYLQLTAQGNRYISTLSKALVKASLT